MIGSASLHEGLYTMSDMSSNVSFVNSVKRDLVIYLIKDYMCCIINTITLSMAMNTVIFVICLNKESYPFLLVNLMLQNVLMLYILIYGDLHALPLCMAIVISSLSLMIIIDIAGFI